VLDRERVAALLLLFVLSLLWSLSYVLIKVAVDSVPPYTIVAGRIAIAALLLFGYVAIRGRGLPRPGREWVLYGAIGLLGNALPFSLISWGQQFIDAGLTAILLGMVPLFTVLLVQFATAEERPTKNRVAGILLGLAGLVVLVGPDALEGIGTATLAQLAVVGGAACYAATTVLARHVNRDRTEASAVVMLLAAMMTVPLSLGIDAPWQIDPTPRAVAAIVFMGAFSTALATIIFFRLVATQGSTFTSTVNYLIPPLGVGWGVALLGERPDVNALLALVLIVAGIALVNQRPRAAP